MVSAKALFTLRAKSEQVCIKGHFVQSTLLIKPNCYTKVRHKF